jgi:hypothetical protein
MVYRIRFRCGGQQSESEVEVEANTPTEAMVKFRHVRGGGEGQSRITSICSEHSCPAQDRQEDAASR